MARKKQASFRQIQNVSLKDVDSARRSIPFIRRTEQQNVREEEFRGKKSKFVRASPTIAGNPVTLDADKQAIIVIRLTANDANVIIAWPQINIYLDVAGGNPDDLWFGGKNITATDALLQIGFTQQIGTQARSGIASNQARVEGEIVNRDSVTHTYYVHVRWLYLIVE